LIRTVRLPVLATGGIMDGAGIAAALALGASAAQLGTAFVGSNESLASAAYRQRLFSLSAQRTAMTAVISGRSARCLENEFVRWGADIGAQDIPDYPVAYDAGKALHAAASAAGSSEFGPHWAGQGAPLARAMSAQELVRCLETELDAGARVPHGA
jgi:nitronate monooxygenase